MTATAARPDYSPVVWSVSKNGVKLWAWLWLRLRSRDRHHVPATGPVILVPNHASYLDPLVVGCSQPRFIRFLAQKGLARFGPMRWWLRNVGVRLIDRDAPSKAVLRSLVDALRAGECVSVFAEGTRSPDGSIGPFRSGVEFLVRRTQAPVVPVGVHGTHRAFPRGARFVWPRRCTVRFGAPWDAERVLAPGGLEALRRTVGELAGLPLRPADAGAPRDGDQVGQGRSTSPADPSPSISTSTPSPSSSSGGGRA